MTDQPTTGTDVIRMALRMKNKRINLSIMARDLSMQTSTLEDFAESRIKTLPPDTLHKIVGYLWPNGGTKLDLERDLLVAVDKTPPIPAGIPPAPVKGSGVKYQSGTVALLTTPLPPLHPPAARPKKREGWLGGGW